MQVIDIGLQGMHQPDKQRGDRVADLHWVHAFACLWPATAQDLHPVQTLDEDGLPGASPPFVSCSRCRPVRRQASREPGPRPPASPCRGRVRARGRC